MLSLEIHSTVPWESYNQIYDWDCKCNFNWQRYSIHNGTTAKFLSESYCEIFC